MTKGGIQQTRSHLSQIVNQVIRGKEYIILRKNLAVAKIVPIEEDFTARAQELIKKTKDMRRHIKNISIHEINEWKKEGRE